MAFHYSVALSLHHSIPSPYLPFCQLGLHYPTPARAIPHLPSGSYNNYYVATPPTAANVTTTSLALL